MIIALLISIFLVNPLPPKQLVRVYNESSGETIAVYADNNDVIPATIDVELTLNGMKSDFGGNKKRFVVPAKTSRMQLTLVTPSRQSGNLSMNANSTIYEGDLTLEADMDYIYGLPYEAGMSCQVSQGYNGAFSHRGENAIDFSMDEGTKVYAARSGIVHKVVVNNSKSCKSATCIKYNNYIYIYHDDGTFTEYVHLQKGGAIVSEGQRVSKGEHIGYSGSTGWTTGPHLHFSAFKSDRQKRKYLVTYFDTVESPKALLKDKKSYTRP